MTDSSARTTSQEYVHTSVQQSVERMSAILGMSPANPKKPISVLLAEEILSLYNENNALLMRLQELSEYKVQYNKLLSDSIKHDQTIQAQFMSVLATKSGQDALKEAAVLNPEILALDQKPLGSPLC